MRLVPPSATVTLGALAAMLWCPVSAMLAVMLEIDIGSCSLDGAADGVCDGAVVGPSTTRSSTADTVTVCTVSRWTR